MEGGGKLQWIKNFIQENFSIGQTKLIPDGQVQNQKFPFYHTSQSGIFEFYVAALKFLEFYSCVFQ